jgi:hypothetical protein
MASTITRSPDGRRGLLPPILAAATTALVLGVGSIVLQRWIAQTRGAAIALVAIWFVVVLIAVAVALRRRPRERRVALAIFGIALVVTVGVGYWTGFRESEVNEDVVIATSAASGKERAAALAGSPSNAPRPSGAAPDSKAASEPALLASGDLEGADGHAGSGVAEIIERPNGERVLTLTDVSVDPGPDVDVLLSSSVVEVDDAINLGGLKGSKGNQQYEIPATANLHVYPNVVLYCNPFTVRIAVAELDV